jgi:L-seryl-tRNA(Ser) seleniumtransferase
VINATGVILHTNLGRAPLAGAAVDAVARVASGYSNLEYDLDDGRRGHRHVHAEGLLRELTGAEAALVANNNAGAMLLTLAAIAAGREVVVSRGELVEIGGGFRVPDVMAQSGAMLREVGTTNRTRVNDYAAAIGERTAAILRVHPSNFTIEGFTERPALEDLVALGRTLGIPVIEDLGSGWLGGAIATPDAIGGEPTVHDSLAAGVDVVAFSGDKLLGGPQCGIVAGRRELIDRARAHPLMRALRADKLTYAALEATLALWLQPAARARIPVYRMLTMTVEEINLRAQALCATGSSAGLHCRVVDGVSTVGGGSAPASELPTRLIAIASATATATALESRLRHAAVPVIGRLEHEACVLDLRTVAEADDPLLHETISAIARARE